jgi:hypothetical protein
MGYLLFVRPHWTEFQGRVTSGSDLDVVLAEELCTGLPVPIDYYMRYLGIRIEDDVTHLHVPCALNVRGPSASVWLRADLPEADRRYWLAHALGHLLTGTTKLVHETREHAHRRDHARAHEFARSILIPTGSVPAATDVMGENVPALSRYYLVPEPLLHERLAHFAL